jgi:hypothetical protein
VERERWWWRLGAIRVGSGNSSKESMLEFLGAATTIATTKSSGEVLVCRSFSGLARENEGGGELTPVSGREGGVWAWSEM